MSKFDRNIALIGEENFKKIQKAKILVLGAGGVGAILIESLCRSGVNHIDIIDNDIVKESNINRQIIALDNTLELNKVDVIKARLKLINNECIVNGFKTFILPENINSLNLKQYDYVIDAIDTISTKIALAEFCYQNNINLISCMGTGNKLDPTKLEITDIYKTSTCPICKVMRSELRKNGVKKLQVCYSKEISKKIVVETENGRHAPSSMMFVPSIAGLMIANKVIVDLIGQ